MGPSPATASAAVAPAAHGRRGRRVGVLALQGDVREHLAILARLGADARPVRTAGELGGCEALVLPGGESTTMERLLTGFDLEAPLLAAIADGLACLATCAGTILLASGIADGLPGQLGLGILDLTVRRNAYGGQRESFEADLAVPVVGPDPMRVAFIRAPTIEDIGADVEVLATFGDRPVAVRQGPHLALTFHPEITGDARLHAWFLDRLVAARGGR